MTTYGAYNAGLPCENKACKSYGSPHPNCRCYGDMAKGGEAKPFCAESRAHEAGCQYFQGGGDVAPAAADGFDPAAYIAQKQAQAPVDADVPEDTPADAPFDPQAYIAQRQKADDDAQTQGPYNTVTAGIEAAGRALVPGFSWLEANQQDMDFMSPDQIQQTLKDTSLDAQDARQQAHPVAAGVGQVAGIAGSLATGVGAPGMISRGVNAAADAVPSLVAEAVPNSRYLNVGAKAIKGFITNGLIQGDDEISKAMLGQGDPEAPVASALVNMRDMGLWGAGGGALGGAISEFTPVQKIAAKKLGTKLTSYVLGMGQAIRDDPAERIDYAALNIPTESPVLDQYGNAYPVPPPEFGKINPGAYRAGQKLVDSCSIPFKTAVLGGAAGGAAIGGERGFHEDGFKGAVRGALEGAGEGAITGVSAIMTKHLAGMGLRKYAVPAVLKMLANGSLGDMAQAINYTDNVQAGVDKIANSVDNLFKAVPAPAYASPAVSRDQIRDYISRGGVTQDIQNSLYDTNQPQPQGYAEGGVVEPEPLGQDDGSTITDGSNAVANHFPDQNVLLQAARGRVSNYLSSLQPAVNQPKLAFDDPPDNTEAERTYENALGVAADPLSVLNHVKDATLEPEHLQHMQNLYPEVLNHLRKKVTEKITEQQLAGKKPPFKVRQSLSLFMGAPLSGDFSPENIRAAQAVFAPPAPQGGAAPPPKKKSRGTAPLSNSDKSFLTADQARSQRMQATK